jgi:hypothetical protein
MAAAMIEAGMIERNLLAVVVMLGCLLPAAATAENGKGKFRLEISGGFLGCDPAMLNLAVGTDERVQRLQYDHYLDFLQGGGEIRSWSVTADGERGRVRSGRMLEASVSYRLSGGWSLAAGLRVQQGGGARDLAFTYTRVFSSGDRYLETLTYEPYRLSFQACWPSLGVHWGRRLGRLLRLEGYAAAGPLLASASYRSAWTYAWDMAGEGYSWPVFRDAGERAEKGSGTGAGLECGARALWELSPRLSAFLTAGHGWQRVNSLSGSGRETRAGRVAEWSGDWVVRSETIAMPWETLAVSYPTCRPQEGAADAPFRLDLSGWRLSAGFSWRL